MRNSLTQSENDRRHRKEERANQVESLVCNDKEGGGERERKKSVLKIQRYQRFCLLSLEEVRIITALCVSSTARISAFLMSTFPVHLLHFFQILFKPYVMFMVKMNQTFTCDDL